MDKKYEIARQAVAMYFERNKIQTRIDNLFHEEIEHVIDIGTQIMLAKWDIRPASGGFVEAFMKNNLQETFGQADETNTLAIRFYVLLSCNLGMPYELFNLLNK